MSTELNIFASRLSHFSAISNVMTSVTSRMAALEQQFAAVAPITEMDEQSIDLLIANATAIIAAAEALKEVEYAPPAPPAPPEEDRDPGDEA
jgi:Holliday junction resolvasome RuvABC endonuclease subunit